MPLKELPEGYGGTSASSAPPTDVARQQFEPDTSVIDMILNAPSAIGQAISGEGVPIEFPDLPELTDMGSDAPGFFEGFGIRLKGMLARDDFGKAEIIHDAFDGDPRYGGKFVDKFGLPIIVWNNIPYYVNKPGFSGQDFNTMLGEMLRYAPATKFAGRGKTALETAARGVPAYSATELASIAGEAYVTPETTKAKARTYGDIAGQVGLSTGIGVTADVAFPVVGKAIGMGAKAVAQAASKTGRNLGAAFDEAFPRFNFDVIQESKYPLTLGQRTAEPPQGVTPKDTEQIGREDLLRQSTVDDPAKLLLRGFDENQLAAIRNDAMELQAEFGAGTADPAGIYGNIPSLAAEAAQETVSGAAQRLKEESSTLYDLVKGADSSPVMTAEGVQKVTQELLDVVPTILAPSQIVDGPLLREIQQLRKLRKIAQNPKFKDQALKNIHGYQKRLRTAIGQAERGSPEELALIQMKQKLDDAVYNGIERGFITGDQEVLDQLQQATGLYSDYMAAIGRGAGRNPQERAANRILEQLSNNQYTPVQVANLLFGQNKFAPKQAMGVVLDKLEKALDPNDYQQFILLLKDGIMTKAFAGKGGEVTRTSIVNNYNDVFFQNRDIINRVFSPEEIARIKQFRANVLPTLWAEVKANPSGSGYALYAAAQRANLLVPSVMGRAAIAKGVDVAEGVARREDAMNAVSQTLQRMQTPMFSDVAQGAIRTAISPEIEAEGEPSTDRERMQLLEAIDSLEQQKAQPEPEPAPKPTVAPPAAQVMPQPQQEISMFEPLPEAKPAAPAMGQIDPAMSPTILPSDKDRELAMRLRGPLGGIASLA